MVKNLLQDVVPPAKRSIRNVPVPAYRKKITPKSPVVEQVNTPPAPIKTSNVSMPVSRQKNLRLSDVEMAPPIVTTKKSRWKLWTVLSVILVIVAIILVSNLFSSATVSITPRQQKVTVEETFRAGDLVNGIPYEVITLSKTEGKSVSATENETVEERASGTIVIYNNNSTASQRLVKNTRFETPEGLIYRIQDSVTVPGQTTKDGKTVPGSVEATVYADAPGDKYNIAETDFTIPGFKGDPKYKTFYARSKTPMSGGFIGVRKKVSDSVKQVAIADLKNVLTTKLTQEIRDQVPNNFVMFDETVFIEFENAPQADVTNSSVTINLKGTARVAIFDKDLLETAISNRVSPALNKEDVEFSGMSGLKVEVKNKNSVDIKNHGMFDVSLSGSGVIWTVFPEDKIKSELAGNTKSVLQTVLSQHSSIEEAQAKLTPFWKRSFPEDPKNIGIIRVLRD